MSAHPLEAGLRASIEALGLDLSDDQVARLLAYQGLGRQVEQGLQPDRAARPQEMLTHHLLDSLAAVAPLRRHLAAAGLEKPRLLDVGSGAGLPGAVFAIVCPGLDVSCVDTVAKKALFIQRWRLPCGCRTCMASTPGWRTSSSAGTW